MPFSTRTLRQLARVMTPAEKLDLIRMMISSESEGKLLTTLIASEPLIYVAAVEKRQAEVRSMFHEDDAHPMGRAAFEG